MDFDVDQIKKSDSIKSAALAKKIFAQWESYSSSRANWIKNVAEDNDFFNGKHYTAAEIIEMKLNGMAPVVVERIKPIILQEVAIFVATRPTFKALPRDDADPAIAALWSDILTWIWQRNDGDSKYQQCITNYFSVGAGYLFIGIDPYADDGSGEVTMSSLPVWDVYPDPLSREIDLSDARSIKISRLVPKSTLKFNFPDQVEVVNMAKGSIGPVDDKPLVNPLLNDGTNGYGFSQNDYSYIGNDDESVRVIEDYEKIRVPYWKVFDMERGSVEIYTPEEWDPSYAKKGQHYNKIWRTRVRVTATIDSSTVLYRTVLPTDTYPIIPFYLHHNGTPWVSGDVSLLKGTQRVINKSHSIMIHNASQMSNFRWISQRGSIVDKQEWEETGARAGTILEYTQGFDKPEPIYPGQLPAGWFQLEGLEKDAMEYSVGVFSNMMGSNTGAPDTYRGMLALEEAGQRKIKFKVQHANHALRRLGRVMVDYAQALYKMPKIMRIAGEKNEDYRDIYLNQMGIDPITKEMKKFNDPSIGKYDIVAYDGTSMPTNRMALLQMNMELYQLGIIDQEEALKKTDVVNKDALIERMGKAQQLATQVNQMEDSLKQIEGLNQTLRRQLQQSMVKNDATNAGIAINTQMLQTEMEQKLVRARMSDELGVFQERLALERNKVSAQGASAAAMFKAREHILLNQAKKVGADDGKKDSD